MQGITFARQGEVSGVEAGGNARLAAGRAFAGGLNVPARNAMRNGGKGSRSLPVIVFHVWELSH